MIKQPDVWDILKFRCRYAGSPSFTRSPWPCPRSRKPCRPKALQSRSNGSIGRQPTLFVVLAAANAAGYDAESIRQ